MSDSAALVSQKRRRSPVGRKAAPVAVTKPDIAAFTKRNRRQIARLVASSPRVADLVTVYPGLLHALAVKRGSLAKRRLALAQIRDGAPLKEVAATLDMPMWMRRLPANAFDELPERLPTSEAFGSRIATRLPRHSEASAFWLESVLFAERAVSEAFAIWLAGQPVFADDCEDYTTFSMLAAYAWFSTADDCEARRLIYTPWHPDIGFASALCAAKSWLNRINLLIRLPVGHLTDPWLQPGDTAGLTFVPLLDAPTILAEAGVMQNCADQYADRLCRDLCRLFSVRRDGAPIATLEIGAHIREAGVLAITQLKGRKNTPVRHEVWQAAYGWLAAQPTLLQANANKPQMRTPATFDDAAWHRLFEPYRAQHDGAPWVAAQINGFVMRRLQHDMTELARRAGVTSWLFTWMPALQ